MKIEKIEIENFRSIRKKVTLEDSLTSSFKVFVGPNNSGKSNILRALNLFFNLESEPGICFNSKKDITIGANKTSNITLKFKFLKPADNKIVKYIDDKYPETFRDHVIQLTLRLYTNGTTQYVFTTGKGYKSTAMDDLRVRLLEYVNCIYVPAIKDYKNVINKDMMRRIVASTFHGWGRGRTSKKLGEHKEDFQKIMENLQKILNISGDSMTEMFKGVVSSVERFDFSLPYDNLEDFLGRLVFQITETGIKDKVSLDSEGSGIQSYTIYSMLKLLHELRPTNTYKKSKYLWLIEEPETFMHHDLQRRTFNKLKEYSKDGHIFITTHSPIFIDKRDYSNSFEVVKNTETEIKKIRANNVGKLITGSLGVGFDELGLFNRFNILVEGKTDKNLILGLNNLFHQAGESNLLDEKETMFIECGSASAISHFYHMYNVFNQYGSFYALFDRDKAGMDARENLRNKGVSKDLLVLIPESDYKKENAIEDIVQKEIWDKCLNYIDDKKLVTIKKRQGQIVDYEYFRKDRVPFKTLFVKKLLEHASEDLQPFRKYLNLIHSLSSIIQKES